MKIKAVVALCPGQTCGRIMWITEELACPADFESQIAGQDLDEGPVECPTIGLWVWEGEYVKREYGSEPSRGDWRPLTDDEWVQARAGHDPFQRLKGYDVEGIRDPEHPCVDYKKGPLDGGWKGICETDGHYLCQTCKWRQS